MKIKVKEIVKFDRMNTKANGSVDVSFKAMYSQITQSISVLQMLNNDVKISVKVEDKIIKLGMFRVKNVKFDGDGESILYFNSISDNVEMDRISDIVVDGEFVIQMAAEIEDEE